MGTNRLQKGWTLAGTLLILLGTALGSAAGWAVIEVLPEGSAPAIPYILIPVLLLPLTMAFSLLDKLGDMKQQDNLSKREKLRLDRILDGKIRQVRFALAFYILAAIAMATSFYIGQQTPELFQAAAALSGGLLGISAASMLLIVNEFNAIKDFKGHIHDRKVARTRQQALVRKMITHH